MSRRQTVLLTCSSKNESHRDPEYIDFSVPRLARYMHSAWKRHQDAVFWVDIDLGIKERLMFYQTRSNAIILQGTLPAHCISRVERLKMERCCMKDDICLLDHQRSHWNTISIELKEMINRVLQLNISQLENSFNSHLEKHFKLVLPSQPNSLNPLKIERRNLWPKRLLVSCKGNLVLLIRTGEPVKDEDKRVMKDHDRTGKPVEASSHKVQEVGSLEHRDDANKFNFAIDDENIDFNISSVPNAMVKRSHNINVHNLIQQIENHPQRQALQSDLQQHRAPNLFSKESKDAFKAARNTELFEIVDVEPKIRVHWHVGMVYCTCGHLIKDATKLNKKYISSVLDLFSIPNFYMRKGRPHGHRYGKAPGCKECHTANQLQKRCRKKKYDNIHDRFIRDKFFRKTMIELGRSEEIILEMDRLESEDHTHIAIQEEIDVHRGNWWICSNVVNFDTMPTRHQLDFKKALSTLPPKESGGQEALWKVVTKFLFMVAMANELVWTLLWEFTTKEWPQFERRNLSTQWINYSFAVWISATIECKIYRDFIGNSWPQSTVTDGWCK